jgi:hypothetical protein
MWAHAISEHLGESTDFSALGCHFSEKYYISRPNETNWNLK